MLSDSTSTNITSKADYSTPEQLNQQLSGTTERFVPFILDGTKTQTIRAFRKHPIRRLQPAHLYYGMRTKYCRKLVDPSPLIYVVYCIAILEDGTVRKAYCYDLSPREREKLMAKKTIGKGGGFTLACETLTKKDKDELAWTDGFRHADKPNEQKGCFEIMYRWWKQTHSLPFVGQLICWEPAGQKFTPKP